MGDGNRGENNGEYKFLSGGGGWRRGGGGGGSTMEMAVGGTGERNGEGSGEGIGEGRDGKWYRSGHRLMPFGGDRQGALSLLWAIGQRYLCGWLGNQKGGGGIDGDGVTKQGRAGQGGKEPQTTSLARQQHAT